MLKPHTLPHSANIAQKLAEIFIMNFVDYEVLKGSESLLFRSSLRIDFGIHWLSQRT
ncbi:hypothetical protein L211DRAFT_837455 [Terfezia boudieri ATCC MYA-4762]|uniref:Uncharacterized protein n=1 Tax=Terfezia boudieri ATCC MYA-4762 TaxID=1051890 RepID=A0A3N4LNS0_9PEZI|nr:hypothetical protein L211DRAFT_837455 [Terfezia boudieri ATCC MYA-4762]